MMRFCYQSEDREGVRQKMATTCISVSSTATTKAIIEALTEKFRPDMKILPKGAGVRDTLVEREPPQSRGEAAASPAQLTQGRGQRDA